MRKNLLLVAVALVWCGLSGVRAQAQADYEADFDATFPTFGYGYGYSGYGLPNPEPPPAPFFINVDSSSQTPATFSVNTAPAATASLDTTNWVIPPEAGYNYAGWGLGIGFFFPEDMRPTSGDLSQYTISFDAKVEGYESFDDGIRTNLLMIFQGPNFQADEYSVGVNGNNLGQFPEVPLLTSTVQTISRPLSDYALINTNWDFTTLFAGTTQLLVQLEPATNVGEIGLDNNNVLTVDNVRIEGPFATGGVLGDYDGDNDVDGNDFVVWQRGQSPGGVVAADLTDWRNNFGTQPMGGATAIPEPGCLTLVGAAALALVTAGRRGARRT
jgi:hypothetical protein